MLHQVHGGQNLGSRHVRSGLMDGFNGELGLRQMVPLARASSRARQMMRFTVSSMAAKDATLTYSY